MRVEPNPRPSRAGGLLSWLLLALVAAVFALFVVAVYLPAEEERVQMSAKVEQSKAGLEEAEQKLEQEQDRNAELVAEPKKVVERIYAQLAIPLTADYERTLVAEQERARKHEAKHRYSLEQFGLEAGEIRARLADLFERFGWEDAR